MKYFKRLGWIFLGIIIGGGLAILYTGRPSKIDKTNARMVSRWSTEQHFNFIEDSFRVPFKDAKYITRGQDGKQKVILNLGEASLLRLHYPFGTLRVYSARPPGYKRITYKLSELTDYDSNFEYIKSKDEVYRANREHPERYLDGIFISKKPLLLGQRIVISCDITFLPSTCSMRSLHLSENEFQNNPIIKHVFSVNTPNRKPCHISDTQDRHDRHWDYQTRCMHLYTILEQLPQELEKLDKNFDGWRQSKVEVE